MTGWREDGIAETRPAATTTGNIQTNGWGFYSAAIQAEGAIAGDDRTLTSLSGVNYKFAPYDAPNMAIVSPWLNGDITLTLKTPIATDELYVLGTGVGGSVVVSMQAIYSDGTSSAFEPIRFRGWTSLTSAAVTGLGRIKRGATDAYAADEVPAEYNYNLFEGKIATDKTKQVSQIIFRENTALGYILVMAVSAKADAVSTGVTPVVNTEASQVVGVYNANGVQLAKPAKGVNIFKYADGSTRKVVVN